MQIINVISGKSVSYKEVNIKITNVLRKEITTDYYIDGIIEVCKILGNRKYNIIDEELYYSNNKLNIKNYEFRILIEWFFTTYKVIL
jgi:hypothetical protein